MNQRPDLSGLRRPEAGAAPSAADIPMPASRWKSRLLLPGIALALFALVFLAASWEALAPKTDVRVVPVVVKRGVASSGAIAFQASGWIEPVPFPTFASALTDGVVAEVLVLEGQRVKKGDVLARLVPDDAELSFTRAAAHATDMAAQLEIAKAERDAAQRDWDNPVERERAVAVSEAKAAAAAAEVERLGHLEQVHEGRVAEFAEQLARDEKQLPEQAITEWEVVRNRLRLTTEKASLEAVRSQRDVARAGNDQAQAEVHAARENLRLRIRETLELASAKARVEKAAAALAESVARREEAELRVSRLAIRAPIDGVVMTRLAAPGAKLMLAMDAPHSAHVVHLYDPAHLQVRVDVPLADAAGVGVDQIAQIVPDVLPDRTFEGVVTRIVHEADIQKNTLQVKVAVKDPAPELKPEMLARVRFYGRADPGVKSEAERIFAPERLLSERAGSNAVVWTVDGSKSARRRTVTLGTAKQDGWVEVASGLAPGDVLIDGVPAGLGDGDGVRITGEGR